MKNKSEKLARNAIRARKAKNKRANEQDKPKKGKRWLIRLGALMGCLLLVSALVVPCFADPVYYPAYTVTDDFYTAFINYNISEHYRDNDLLLDIIDRYRDGYVGTGDNGLFDCGLLCYGSTTFTEDTIKDTGIYTNFVLTEDSSVHSVVYTDCAFIKMSTLDPNDYEFASAYNYGHFEIDLIANGDDVVSRITFTGVWNGVTQRYVFTNVRGSYNDTSPIEFFGPYSYEVYGDDNLLQSGILTGLEVSYTLRNTIIFGTIPEGVSLLQNLLFSENQDTYYHPLAFANGYFAGQMENGTYSDGYNTGYTTGYNTGKNEGYVIGHNDGYDAGYEAGFEVSYDSGYTDGYNEGVNTTDSANLGKNLIGETLSAPIEGLKQFKLINWVTENGKTISISLLSVLSAALGVTLVIWFLKLFAGG